MTMKPLGQVVPSAGVLTDMYTVPTGKETVVSSLMVAEQGSLFTMFRVAVAGNGQADGGSQYLAWNTPINPNDVVDFTIGATLQAGDILRVWSHEAPVAFSAFGEEKTAS